MQCRLLVTKDAIGFALSMSTLCLILPGCTIHASSTPKLISLPPAPHHPGDLPCILDFIALYLLDSCELNSPNSCLHIPSKIFTLRLSCTGWWELHLSTWVRPRTLATHFLSHCTPGPSGSSWHLISQQDYSDSFLTILLSSLLTVLSWHSR